MKTLRKQAIDGFLWTIIDTFFVKAMPFVTIIIISKVIGPTQVGIFGMMSVFIAIGHTIANSGMANSLIRTKNTDSLDYSTVFITNILLCILVYFIIYFSAPLIANFYNQSVLVELIRVYCLVLIPVAFSVVQVAILTSNMGFKELTKINFPSTIIGVIVGLLLVFNDFGIWSIIWMYLTIEFVRALLLWVKSKWKPNFVFSIIKFRYHYKFGSRLMLSGIIDAVFNNIHNVLIGKYFSPQNLGFYERSKQFSNYPSSTITSVISKVTYPLLSKLKNDNVRLKSVYRKLIKVSFFINAPFMFGLAAIAKPLMIIVMGEEWLPSVLYFQVLCISAAIYPIHSFNLNILQVCGRSDLFLKIEFIKKIIVLVSIVIAFQFGIIGLVWSSVASSFIALIVNMYYTKKLINYSIKEQFSDLIFTFLISLITSSIINILVFFFKK